jgi:broad specificity phosphatase PhoE
VIPPDLEATLVLLRHGESVLITEDRFQGQADSPLSPLGRRQAALAGRRLAQPHRSPALPLPHARPLEIVHSPLLRTTETAQAVARAIGEEAGEAGLAPTLRGHSGLLEIAQGVWEGMLRLDVASRYADELAAWRRDPIHHEAPDGERVVDAAIRVREALSSVLAALAAAATDQGVRPTNPASPVSGYPGSAPAEAPWSVVVGHDGMFKVLLLTLFDLPLERFWSFPFALAGLSVVEIRAGRPILRLHASTEHLAPLLEEQALDETEERQQAGAL